MTNHARGEIKTFADQDTQALHATERSTRWPPDIWRRAVRKLEHLDLAVRLEDLRIPRGNRLHALSGDRTGQHSISINDPSRNCFRFENGDAYDVEICDYH